MTDDDTLTDAEQRAVDEVASRIFAELYMLFRGTVTAPALHPDFTRTLAAEAFGAALLYGHERHLACEHCCERDSPKAES
jgi:hypothetical protein